VLVMLTHKQRRLVHFQCNGAFRLRNGRRGQLLEACALEEGPPVPDPGPRPSLWERIFAPAKTLDFGKRSFAPRCARGRMRMPSG